MLLSNASKIEISGEQDKVKNKVLKGGPFNLGTKISQNSKRSSLYPLSLLIFIHKHPVVENHPTTREIIDLLSPGRHRREPRSILTEAARLFTYWKYTDEASYIASDENIMEINYIYVMLSNQASFGT